MKNIFSLLLLLAVLVSCNKKEDTKPVVVDKKPVIEMVIGLEKDGKYSVSDIDTVSYKWNSYINKKLKPADSIILQDFEIIKTKTKGETIEDCYLLVAKAEKQKINVGTILTLRDGRFYTTIQRNSDSYEIIICTGVCNSQICNPDVVVAGGAKRLICSSCDECAKISASID